MKSPAALRALVHLLAVLASWSLLLASGSARAQLPDPWADWQSADSAHFRVHYRGTQRAQAEQVARAAERVYPRVTQSLQWEPRGRTEILVLSEYDLTNGYSTPLPFNIIGVYLAPGDEGELLDNSAWLDLLLVHEFTHTVHLDKVRSAPKVLQAIFGRIPWFIPNLFEPSWVVEGLAVYNESEPEAGRGRLRSPLFEAWLRAERQRGFLKIAEINADGRALPLSKNYLYGVYFFDFLARRYGKDKVAAYVERYSGNIVPRLHSNPVEMTGKPMDELWDEFLADLAAQVDARAEPIKRQPETIGERMAGPLFEIPAVVGLPNGDLLAVLDDGVGAPTLTRIGPDGAQQAVTRVQRGTRLDASADGRVLLAQPDICGNHYLTYDLYRLDGDSLRQVTDCAHLRRGAVAGQGFVAIQLDAGRSKLLRLDADGREQAVLYAAPDDTDLIDLAASADGQRVAVIVKREGDWRIVEFDATQPQATPRLLVRSDAPLTGLRQGAAGLEVIAAHDGVYNVWRLKGATLERVTHSHTSVVAQSGSLKDGSLASVVVVSQGFELHRLRAAGSPPLQSIAAVRNVPEPVPQPADRDGKLGDGRSYSALRSIYPRSWFPAITSDRGLTAYGASTSGGDAFGWHQYAALAQWETSQKELIGSIEYGWLGQHFVAFSRSLTPRAWTGDKGKEDTTLFDRNTQAQWVSLLPWLKLDRRINFGIGAALDRVERVRVADNAHIYPRDERLAAALVDIDTRGANWYSEGANRGQHSGLIYETYKPFARDVSRTPVPDYDGEVLRADLRGFVPLGRSVLALRYTEARARGRTEPFQLGGATDPQLQLGVALNNRDISLRGYRGDEPQLQGRNARVATLEGRTPIADIDRHGMVPPFGINRLSATAFLDVGGAWDSGGKPDRYRRGVGFELLGEVRMLYALGLQLRLGVARGLDAPKSTRGYLTAGSSF